MSAGAVLMAGVLAHLRADGVALPLFDCVPVRAACPWGQVEDAQLRAEDGAGVLGRVGTLAIQCRDGGERPVRLRALVGQLEAAMAVLPAELDDGWRVAALTLAGSRIWRGKDEWLARSTWAVRLFRAG